MPWSHGSSSNRPRGSPHSRTRSRSIRLTDSSVGTPATTTPAYGWSPRRSLPWGCRSEPGSRPARSGVFHRPPTSCPQDWFASATIVGVTVRQCWVATLLGKRNEPSKTGRTGDQRLSSVARPLVTASGTPLVRRPALPPRGRLLRRPHGVFRWAGRQGVPPRAGVPPLTGPPTDATTSTSGRITRMSDDEKFAARPGMTDEVLYARDGRLGQILLNRPKVINALTAPMVTSELAQLQDCAQDDAVLAVSIHGDPRTLGDQSQ